MCYMQNEIFAFDYRIVGSVDGVKLWRIGLCFAQVLLTLLATRLLLFGGAHCKHHQVIASA